MLKIKAVMENRCSHLKKKKYGPRKVQSTTPKGCVAVTEWIELPRTAFSRESKGYDEAVIESNDR